MTFCDSETGLCGDGTTPEIETQFVTPTPEFEIWFATDPICSHCWALEPAWRKLLFHYGEHLHLRHIYGGLLPGWQGFADEGAGIRRPADVAPHWAEVAHHYGQPIDPSVWLQDPLDSSYPPSIAVHAVRLMDPEHEEPFLRRIRQALFLEARNIARFEALAACAPDLNLDAAQFEMLFTSGIAERAFQQDLSETRRLPVRGFPTLMFHGTDGQTAVLHGTQSYAKLEQTFLQITGLPRSGQTPTATEILAAYGSGTTPEFAEALGLGVEETRETLESAGAVAIPVADDALWTTSEASNIWRKKSKEHANS